MFLEDGNKFSVLSAVSVLRERKENFSGVEERALTWSRLRRSS